MGQAAPAAALSAAAAPVHAPADTFRLPDNIVGDPSERRVRHPPGTDHVAAVSKLRRMNPSRGNLLKPLESGFLPAAGAWAPLVLMVVVVSCLYLIRPSEAPSR